MRRPPKREFKIEMTPFLDSLVIMMSLICLVLVIMLMPVVENPQQFKVLSFEQLFSLFQRRFKPDKRPYYIDCRPDGAVVIPGDIMVSLEDLRKPDNEIDRLLDKIQKNKEEEYVVLLARPGAQPVYRHLKKELIRRDIIAGADILEANAHLDWREEMRQLRIHTGTY